VRRNAIIAMGNSGNREFIPLLERIKSDDDEAISDCATWAIEKLRRAVKSA
jgi:epoxyqueuosine reductase